MRNPGRGRAHLVGADFDARSMILQVPREKKNDSGALMKMLHRTGVKKCKKEKLMFSLTEVVSPVFEDRYFMRQSAFGLQ